MGSRMTTEEGLFSTSLICPSSADNAHSDNRRKVVSLSRTSRPRWKSIDRNRAVSVGNTHRGLRHKMGARNRDTAHIVEC